MLGQDEPGFRSVQFVGVDSIPPEESPARNRPVAGAGPLPPPEDKVADASDSDKEPDAMASRCVQDVQIEVNEQEAQAVKESDESRSRLGPHCKRVSLAQTISDEEALAALEAAQWPPVKPATSKVVDFAGPSDEDSVPSPLPSPPMAPATPAPITPATPTVSPGPSRSRTAAAAAAAAAARAAAGARSAMAAAGSHFSTGGAALATLVSPEPAPPGADKRASSSVFSGRFMPLSLWAQAESSPPASGPGSPEQNQDIKLVEDLEAACEGMDKMARVAMQASGQSVQPQVQVSIQPAVLPTPPVAPAERATLARGSSAPPDPCRSKSGPLEADPSPIPRPMSADSLADVERQVHTGLSIVLPTEEGDGKLLVPPSPPTSPQGARGRQGGRVASATFRGQLSPSSPADANANTCSPDQAFHLARPSSRPPPEPETQAKEIELDVLQPAPSAEPEERISNTRMPSMLALAQVLSQEEASPSLEAISSGYATDMLESPAPSEARPKTISRETRATSVESASPPPRRSTFQGARLEESRSRSCSRNSGANHRAELQVSRTHGEGVTQPDRSGARELEVPKCEVQRDLVTGTAFTGIDENRSVSPFVGDDAGDALCPFNDATDFTFAPLEAMEDAGHAAARSEEDAVEDANPDGLCASLSSTANTAITDLKTFRREDPKETADLEVKRIETCKQSESDRMLSVEADLKSSEPSVMITTWGSIENDDRMSEGTKYLEGLESRKSPQTSRRSEGRRLQRNRGRPGSNYQDALDCLRLQAGFGMDLAC
ncbi:unnamed protein product [Effrenium voratum]|nr:unnamed protein product [Effrenium voratum]